MCSDNDRVISYLDAAINEMELLAKMTENLHESDEFLTSLSGMVLFRACGMSLQYITENFVKIRNLRGQDFFKPYREIPWNSVFGMRNFLSHEYGDVDAEGIFNTVKNNIPHLLAVTRKIKEDTLQ